MRDSNTAGNTPVDYDTQRFGWEPLIPLTRWSLRTLKVQRVFDSVTMHDGMRILDCGCGEGALTRTLKSQFPSAVIAGCDISRNHLRRAEEASANIEYRLICGQLPYGEQEFDVVILLDVLEHVDDPQSLLHDVTRVLRPHGKLLLHCPCEGHIPTLHWLGWKLRVGHNLKRDLVGHIQRFTHGQVLVLAQNAQLRCMKVRYQYHMVGQVADCLMFWKKWCIQKVAAGSANWLQRLIGNMPTWRFFKVLQALSYWESRVLAHVPLAMGMDAVFEKE